MKKIITILLFIPCFLQAQTSYDRYTQNPKIDASTNKNVSQDATLKTQDAIIKKLIADTSAKSLRIKTLETTQKEMQSTLANMGAQISAISRGLYDSTLSLRNFINAFSLTPDTSQFIIIDKTLRIKDYIINKPVQ